MPLSIKCSSNLDIMMNLPPLNKKLQPKQFSTFTCALTIIFCLAGSVSIILKKKTKISNRFNAKPFFALSYVLQSVT